MMVLLQDGTQRAVERGCKNCFPDGIVDLYAQFTVVSTAGVAHEMQRQGRWTVCRKDAARLGWWWPV